MNRPIKTPDEIKKGLECYINHSECEKHPGCNGCPLKVYTAGDVLKNAPIRDALALIRQLEAEKSNPGKTIICQITVDGEEILRKALDKTEVDGKTLAEWIELAKGYKQLEAELATAKQERDAAISALHGDCGRCMFQQTVKCDSCRYGVNPFYEHDCWEWEGISPDTEVHPNE